MTVAEQGGVVYLLATPIGNLQDLSPRARQILSEVSVIACEDTRRTTRLCAALGIRTPRVSLYAQNEARRVPGLLRRLERGESIALVSDAGTPLISDPGARLVSAAADGGFRVIPIPGPSAILAALIASGLPTQPFTFLGFPPRRGGARERWLDMAARAPGTLLLFEAPGRVAQTLHDLHRALGPRRVAVARELTKRFEEVRRGRLGELELPELRGEVTVVVEGPGERALDPGELDEDLLEALLSSGVPLTEAARDLARVTGTTRQEAYRRLLGRKRG